MDKIVQAEAAIFIQRGLLGGAFCLQVVTIDCKGRNTITLSIHLTGFLSVTEQSTCHVTII